MVDITFSLFQFGSFFVEPVKKNKKRINKEIFTIQTLGVWALLGVTMATFG